MAEFKFSSIKADLELERQGVWMESQNFDGMSFLVSGITKPSYTIKRDFARQRLARLHKDGIPDHVWITEMGKLYAKELLHDWRGGDIPYSSETALEMLGDYAWRKLISEIELLASRVSEGRIGTPGEQEEELKNSGKPSAGSSKSAAKSEASSQT